MHTSCDALRNSEKHDSTSEKRTSEKAKTEATAQRRTSETRPPHRRRRSGRIYHMTLHHPSARAMRAILYHVPIGEYRARFFFNEPVACPCGETNLETRYHILTECLRYKDRVTLPTPCMTSSSHLIHRNLPSFLTGNLYKTFKSRQIQPHPTSVRNTQGRPVGCENSYSSYSHYQTIARQRSSVSLRSLLFFFFPSLSIINLCILAKLQVSVVSRLPRTPRIPLMDKSTDPPRFDSDCAIGPRRDTKIFQRNSVNPDL